MCHSVAKPGYVCRTLAVVLGRISDKVCTGAAGEGVRGRRVCMIKPSFASARRRERTKKGQQVGFVVTLLNMLGRAHDPSCTLQVCGKLVPEISGSAQAESGTPPSPTPSPGALIPRLSAGCFAGLTPGPAPTLCPRNGSHMQQPKIFSGDSQMRGWSRRCYAAGGMGVRRGSSWHAAASQNPLPRPASPPSCFGPTHPAAA